MILARNPFSFLTGYLVLSVVCVASAQVLAQTSPKAVSGNQQTQTVKAQEEKTKAADGLRKFTEKDIPPSNSEEDIIWSKGEADESVKSINSEVDTKTLKVTNVTFKGDLKIDGRFNQVWFENVRFEGNVTFFVVSSLSVFITDCDFLGAVSFTVDVKAFTLRASEFAKPVNLYGVNLLPDDGGAVKSRINMTRLMTKEPIMIAWSQFGAKWRAELEASAPQMGDGSVEQARLNLRHVLVELEFWRNNFMKLGHKRDATEVLAEINDFSWRHGFLSSSQKTDYVLGFVLRWPSGFGTRPYRPLWLSLLVISVFGLIYWIKDPFTEKDKTKPPTKPRTPRAIFALMYSIDTFVPAIDITRVRDWGWELSPAYRWVAVVERLLGLLIVYAAAYSLTYYAL